MDSLYNIPITIADIMIEVHSPLSATELGIAERLGPFIGALNNPLARVSLTWKESARAPSPHGELIFNSGLYWRMYRAGEVYHAALSYMDEGIQGVLCANDTWDELTLIEQRADPILRSLGQDWLSQLNFIAGDLLLCTKILLTDGIVFHAAGIDDNGRGIIFVGHSGEGKSTQADLWNKFPGVIVINHDHIAIRSNTSGAICYGTPWGGSANVVRNHAVPLSAMILLDQAPVNEIYQLAPSVAAPLLLSRAFLPYWNQTLMQRALANITKLLAQVPVYLLRCRPEPEAVPLVWSVL